MIGVCACACMYSAAYAQIITLMKFLVCACGCFFTECFVFRVLLTSGLVALVKELKGKSIYCVNHRGTQKILEQHNDMHLNKILSSFSSL